MTVRDYIKNKKTKHFTISGIEVYEKDPLPSTISAREVVEVVVQSIPQHLLINVESIYIGSFDFLNDRDVQAVYENSSIFVTNEQDTLEDMLDDIIHEIAHSVEERYGREIYADRKIESEFLHKRKNMWFVLKDQGFESELQNFLEIDYSESFDQYLYQEVGYPVLAMITSNIFYSPYAATSLREYFANGFEAFFMREDIDRLKNISPAIFEKIIKLSMPEQDFGEV